MGSLLLNLKNRKYQKVSQRMYKAFFALFGIFAILANLSKSAPDEIEAGRQVGNALGEFGTALDNLRDLTDNEKEDIIASSLSGVSQPKSYRKTLKKIGSFFKLLKNFEGIGVLYDLFSGESVASKRHKEILQKFQSVSSNFKKISAQLITQTNRVIEAIWQSHQLNYISKLHTVNSNYEAYLDNRVKQNEDFLIKAYEDNDVSDSSFGLRNSIRERARSLVNKAKDCKPIVDLKAFISALLPSPYLAYQLGLK